MTVDRKRLLELSDDELSLTWELVSQAADADAAESEEEDAAINDICRKWHDINHGMPAGPGCTECEKIYGRGLTAITVGIDPDIDEGVYLCRKCIDQHGFAHSQTVIFKIDPAPSCYNCHEPAWTD